MASFGLAAYRRFPYWARIIAGLLSGLFVGAAFAGIALIAFLIGPRDPGGRLAPVAKSLLLAFGIFGLLGGILHPLARNRPSAVLIGALCGAPLYIIVASVSHVMGGPLAPEDFRVFVPLGAIIGGIVGWRCWSEFQRSVESSATGTAPEA